MRTSTDRTGCTNFFRKKMHFLRAGVDKRLNAHETTHPAPTGQVDVVGGFKVIAAVILAQLCAETDRRLVPLQACAGWTETVNCHPHPRILLPQNRCLPEPLAAPFPHQPEPRCNTLDFASKVVCQRDAASRLSARSGASKCAAF